MPDPVTIQIDRLASVDPTELPDLFKTLLRDRQMGRVMRRINAELLGADEALRDRAATVLGRLGFPT